MLAFDSHRRELLLFGGLAPAEPSGAEPLWIFSEAGWRRAQTPMPVVNSSAPRSRSLPAAVYDLKRRRFVLYGGISNYSETRFGDWWEWDGQNWLERSWGRLGPGPRDHHAMAYDSARERIVMHGGSVIILTETSAGEIKTSSEVWYEERWEYDGEGWTPRVSPGPGTRAHHCLAFDAVRKVTLLVGGMSRDHQMTPATWGWNGTAWHKLADSGPGPRTHCRMAFHEPSGEMVLYGGELAGSRAPSGDTWVWNGSEWKERKPVNTPGPRILHAMAYHAERRQVILYGGASGATADDVWAWDGANWSRLG